MISGKTFLRDLELGQLDNTEGYVCATVPQTGPAGIGFISMLGWGNAVTIFTGNALSAVWRRGSTATPVREHETFCGGGNPENGKENLWIGPSLGDWLAMGKGIAWQANAQQSGYRMPLSS